MPPTPIVGAVPSLTRVEAQRRADLVTVSSYDVRLDLDRGAETFDSSTTIRFAAVPGTSTFVDVKPRELRRATLNGRPVQASVVDGRLALDGLAERNELVVEAIMAYSHDGEGLHRHVDPADGQAYLYGMSFLDAAPRWFACFDQPDLKAPFALDVRCPPDWTVVGNAPARRIAAGRWHLTTAHPLATYFTTLVAGPYHTVAAEHDGIILALHARASLAEHLDREAGEILAVTRAALDEFHRLFGIRYPWGEYHQAFVPDLNAGAMENPGCVTLRDSFVFRSRVTDDDRCQRASTIAHEMAHMWFGDLVTMRWWDELWLNESFAEYLGCRVCEDAAGRPAWVQFGIARKSWGYAADRRPTTHPVAGNGVPDARTALNDFDGISYAKGASVLRQLANHLGENVFLNGLRRYVAEHAYGTAEFDDLMSAWTAAGARDLPQWTDRWLHTSGLDTLRVVNGSAGSRVESGGASARRPHTVAVAGYGMAGLELSRVDVTLDAGSVPVSLDGHPVLTLPDASDQTWAKIALTATEWEAMPDLLPAVQDGAARVVIWNALRLAVSDAEIHPALALRIAESGLSTERIDAVIAEVARWAVDTLAGVYLPDGAPRENGYAGVAATAERIAEVAPPASGRQLAAVRAWVAATSDVARLSDWLAGRRCLPDGLLLDTELRWTVVHRLAALGAVTPADVDAEAAADHSAQGVVHAAECRALRPDPAGKERVWQTLMTDADRSNYELYALARGFWHPQQTELTAPFVQRYFAEIEATATLRSGWVVKRLASLAFPRTAVDAATLRSADSLLGRAALDQHIRHSVTDAADDLRRALGARVRFGSTHT